MVVGVGGGAGGVKKVVFFRYSDVKEEEYMLSPSVFFVLGHSDPVTNYFT